MYQSEFDAGGGQLLVVYHPADTGTELDPAAIFAEIAEDAARRAANGHRIATMNWTALREAGAMFGNDGSSYATKAAVAVVYARTG